MKTRTSYVLGMVVMALLLFFLMPYVIGLLKALLVTKPALILRHLQWYLWVAVGAVAYLFIRKHFNKNIKWMEVFSHELTHATFTLLSFNKVHSLSATDKMGGVVYSSGHKTFSDLVMRLAPYCFPLFTYVLLLFRGLITYHGRAIFDVLIGLTLCFHIITFKKQTKPHQPDLKHYPLALTCLYILTAHVLNFCIIVKAFFANETVFSSFWDVVCHIWDQLLGWFI